MILERQQHNRRVVYDALQNQLSDIRAIMNYFVRFLWRGYDTNE
ncbi:MAG: hypothetical protein Q7J98_12880 [Kiritimatiellia bacterium]|nr:hypothetical protein [Kiritimatiellia bacterium]